jgi:hypothetical protein
MARQHEEHRAALVEITVCERPADECLRAGSCMCGLNLNSPPCSSLGGITVQPVMILANRVTSSWV